MLRLSDLDWNPDHYLRGMGNGLLLHESRVSSGEEQSGDKEHGALSAPVCFCGCNHNEVLQLSKTLVPALKFSSRKV